MVNARTETILRDIDALFRLGVVSGMSDGQLLERFAARSGCDSGELAFEAIVRRHGPMVMAVCRRVLGDDHAAEDAFQATFMVLALKSRAIRKQESAGPWLHGVAVRIARRALILGASGETSLCRRGPSSPRWAGSGPGRPEGGPRRGIESAAGKVPLAVGPLLSGRSDAGRGRPNVGLDQGDGIGPAGRVPRICCGAGYCAEGSPRRPGFWLSR